MLIKHGNLTGSDVHIPHSFEYADKALREAAVGFDPEDINKIALQTNNGSYWRLVSLEPTTWLPMASNMFQLLQYTEVTNITYDNSDRITRTDYASGYYCTVTYTASGKVERVAYYKTEGDVLLERWLYTYDLNDRMTQTTQEV